MTRERRPRMRLRLPIELIEQLKEHAQREGVSLNQLVTIAVAEKIARHDMESFYRIRARRSAKGAGWRTLERMGSDDIIEGEENP